MKMNQLILGGLGFSLALGLAGACKTRFDECVEGFNCEGDGTGPRSGGSSPGGENSGGSTSAGGKAGGAPNSGGSQHSGGAHTGGVATSGGMAGEGSGGAVPEPCDGKCKDETPFCDEKTDECVGCLKHSDCKDPTMPMCEEDACVPCKDDFSCTDTLGLSEPVACLDGTTDDLTLETRPKTGECVECGRSSDCGGDVCDLKTNKCLTGLRYRQSAECDPCVNDLECIEGQMCVEQKFIEPITQREVVVGKFCTWLKSAVVGPANECGKVAIGENEHPPFAQELSAPNSAGEVMAFCALTTQTSCLGLKDYFKTKSGCDKETAEANQSAADAVCGASDVSDALCGPKSGSMTEYRCTYPCLGPEDCKPGATCPDSGTAQGYCSL